MTCYPTRCLYVSLLCLLVWASTARAALRPRYGGVLQVPIQEPVTSLDPLRLRYASEREVASHVYEGLATYDTEGNVVPALAASWVSERSDSLWTFTLRPNARFSTGERITAWDVKRSWEALLTPLEHLPSRWLLEAVQGAENSLQIQAGEVSGLQALDDQTLVVRLKHSVPNFPEYLTDLACAVVSRRDGSRLVGSGAFAIESQARESVRLTANLYHRDGRPYLDKVHFRVVPRVNYENCRREGFDICPAFTFGEMDLSFSPAWVHIGQHPFYENHYLILNAKRTPLDDPATRAAIAGAMDKTALLRTSRCDGYPAEHIFPVAWPSQPDTLAAGLCEEAGGGSAAQRTLLAGILDLVAGVSALRAPAHTMDIAQAESEYAESASRDSLGAGRTQPPELEDLPEDGASAGQPPGRDTQADSAADTSMDQQEAAAQTQVRTPQPFGEQEGPTVQEGLAEYILIVRENRDIEGRIAEAIRPVLEKLGFSAEIVPLAPEAFRLAKRDGLYDFCLDVALPRFRDAALSYQAFLAEQEKGQSALRQFQSDLSGTLADIEAPLERIPLLHLNTYFVHTPHVRGVASLPSGQLWVADAWLKRPE